MQSSLRVLAAIGLGVCAVVPLKAQSKHATMFLTTADRSSLLAEQPRLKAGKGDAGTAATITVDPKQTMQTIDGFGFAMTGGSAELLMKMDPGARAAILEKLFGHGKDDIATSYLRLSLGASDMNERVFTYDDMPEGETDPTLAHFSLGPDMQDVVPVMKQVMAINPKIKILGSPWTAPSWMKTNGLPKGGSLKPEFYAVYAQYFVKYIEAMRAQGIPIDAVTTQNEPENPKNTPSLVMTAPEQAEFIKTALGPALQKAGLTTKIILFDHNCDHPEYPMAVLGDAEAAKYVDGSGFHLYMGTIDAMTKVHDAFPNKNLYFTEQMTVERQAIHRDAEGIEPIAQPVARVVIGATRNWSRNVLLWNLAADSKFEPHTNSGGCPVCQGAITIDGSKVTENIAFYTVAQVAKFVPPGSVRVGSNEVAEMANVAFRRPDKKIVVVVANEGAEAKSFAVTEGKRTMPVTLAGHAVATIVW